MVATKTTAYCFSCKKKRTIDSELKIIKRKIPNGNTVQLLCGKCKGCGQKICRIVSNK